ncbi:MAG TPA: DinB family protein [Chloroflexia bacterium]|nr:DinB family protein [Chloroflexia bacterium]
MDTELLITLYEYLTWARNRMLDAAAGLTPEQLHQAEPGGYGAIYATLVHMAVSEWMWLERIEGRSPAALPGAAEFPDLAGLRTWWDAVHARSMAYLQRLDTAELRREIHYTGPDGHAYQRQVWHALLHVPNHQTEHRAQIAGLLTRFGVPAPPTDLVVFLKVPDA